MNCVDIVLNIVLNEFRGSYRKLQHEENSTFFARNKNSGPKAAIVLNIVLKPFLKSAVFALQFFLYSADSCSKILSVRDCFVFAAKNFSALVGVHIDQHFFAGAPVNVLSFPICSVSHFVKSTFCRPDDIALC